MHACTMYNGLNLRDAVERPTQKLLSFWGCPPQVLQNLRGRVQDGSDLGVVVVGHDVSSWVGFLATLSLCAPGARCVSATLPCECNAWRWLSGRPR